MIIQSTANFDRQFAELPDKLQKKAHTIIDTFINCYSSRHFPKGLRVHKCGPFLSLSISMKHRIFVFPIPGGIRFVFVGDHAAADRYIR